MKMLRLALAPAVFTLLGLLLVPAPADAHHVPKAVSILRADGSVFASMPSANAGGGAAIATGDVDGDGAEEVLAAAGIGNEPRVRVFGADGNERGSFLAYASDMGVGINLAACDLDGDGRAEIVTAPMRGGAPHVRVFAEDGRALADGHAYAEAFRGGVNLACGDVTGDGRAEIVTLPAAGGGPHVRVWKFEHGTLALTDEFFAEDASDRRGLVGAVDADGSLWLATSQGAPGTLARWAWGSTGVARTRTLAIAPAFEASGVTVIAAEADGIKIGLAGTDRTLLAPRAPGGTWTEATAHAANPVFAGAFHAPGRPLYGATADDAQYILVDLSEQRLYAYENGVLANTFLVSTGKAPYKTPIGVHRVLAKVPNVYYAGVDLDGTAWDLGLVPYNLRIIPRYYIHYAYWHNNFGHPMSHGCVNVSLENMKWIYAWAQEGTSVEIRA